MKAIGKTLISYDLITLFAQIVLTKIIMGILVGIFIDHFYYVI